MVPPAPKTKMFFTFSVSICCVNFFSDFYIVFVSNDRLRLVKLSRLYLTEIDFFRGREGENIRLNFYLNSVIIFLINGIMIITTIKKTSNHSRSNTACGKQLPA